MFHVEHSVVDLDDVFDDAVFLFAFGLGVNACEFHDADCFFDGVEEEADVAHCGCAFAVALAAFFLGLFVGDEAFGLFGGKIVADGCGEGFCAKVGVGFQERPSVAFGETRLDDLAAFILGQAEQAKFVRNRGLTETEPNRRLLLGQSELADEPTDALRLFKAIEVAALQILGQAGDRGFPVGEVGHEAGDAFETCDASRPKATFAADQLKFAADLADGQRLQEPELGNALCEGFKFLPVELAARLIGAGADLGNADLSDGVGGSCGGKK